VLGRLLASAMLLRELYAVPFTLWLMAPVIVAGSGGFPFTLDPTRFLASCAALAAGRWLIARSMHRIELTPFDDALDLAYGAPGSLLALSAAGSKRVRATADRLPERPLVWAALALTLVVSVPLMSHDARSTASGSVASALAIVDLLALWMFALRAAVQRAWARATGRFPLDLEAWVDGIRVTTRDGSAAGLAVTGELGRVGAADRMVVRLLLDDGSTLEVPAVVAHHGRIRTGEFTAGLSLTLSADERVRWFRQLFAPALREASASVVDTAPRRTRSARPEPRDRRATVALVVDRAALALVGLVSAVGIGALLLILVGYRPLVVRSGSMIPTIGIGDVAILERVRATDVHQGDIVNFDDPEGGDESVTHRVRAMNLVDGRVNFETRGDANSVSEFWSVPADALIGHEVLTVPKIGTLVSKIDTRGAQAMLLALAIGLVVVPATGSRIRARSHEHEDAARQARST
jgi:signal peptidase I